MEYSRNSFVNYRSTYAAYAYLAMVAEGFRPVPEPPKEPTPKPVHTPSPLTLAKRKKLLKCLQQESKRKSAPTSQPGNDWESQSTVLQSPTTH
jgi:hypothetical protein